jgi:hypothetical protein
VNPKSDSACQLIDNSKSSAWCRDFDVMFKGHGIELIANTHCVFRRSLLTSLTYVVKSSVLFAKLFGMQLFKNEPSKVQTIAIVTAIEKL